MCRKVFLSFLGTNNYIPCNYIFEDGRKIENVKYIQEASIKHSCLDYDKFYFFLTKEARLKNWYNETTDNSELLLARLNQIEEIKNKIETIDIPDGFTKKDILTIFDIIVNLIEENDELLFDITHAFRSLPLLGMTLINYLKVIKKCKINGIYYGAFEALGPVTKVSEMPIEQRNAQVIEFISFSLIQDWAIAANNFLEFGNADKLKDLTQQEIRPILKETQGNNITAANLRIISNTIPEILSNIATSRGFQIYNNPTYSKLKNTLKDIQNEIIPPLNPIIKNICQKIENINSEDNIKNGFRAVQWCIDYNWTQQGFTILQETLISYILSLENIDWKEEDNRNILTSCFAIAKKNIPEENWLDVCKKNAELTKLLLNSKYIHYFMDDMNQLTQYRNDINHCGIRQNPLSAEKLKEKLKKVYCSILAKII